MFLLLILFSRFSHLHVVRTTHTEILVALQYDLPGYTSNAVFTQPAFYVSQQRAMQRYGSDFSISIQYFQNTSHKTCDDVMASNVKDISEYLYRQNRTDNCYLIITNDCNDQNGLSSLAAELDVMMFSLNPGLLMADLLTPNLGPPTTVSVGQSALGFSMAVLRLLVIHEWYSAVYLTDVSPTGSSFYRDLVYVLFMTAKLVLRILEMTDELGMTNGEFVFINVQPLQSPTYGTSAQFTLSANHAASLSVYRSLIFITNQAPDNNLSNVNLEIADRARTQFNYTYPEGVQPLNTTIAEMVYNAVELFALLVNESCHGPMGSCSGLRLAELITNRTFDLTTRNIYITPGRGRLVDLDVYAFNTSSSSLEVIGMYDSGERRFSFIPGRSIPWPTRDGKAPRDVPLCGFSGKEGICTINEKSTALIAALAVVACIVLLIGFSCVTRHYFVKSHLPADEWKLNNQDLRIRWVDDNPFRRSMYDDGKTF
ncbi:hypothetical protein BV898_07976 [Hypsibius exemplaris]|uniref:Receptor ligand binding region domain-containing protein n=1 Tax=Hypsibius exemplaris TaxID=2072580 RepID=A0A1W0WS65_HYPEX|nr:hypothetical protein BV898_07976 [Hypsibius exemplaris]